MFHIEPFRSHEIALVRNGRKDLDPDITWRTQTYSDQLRYRVGIPAILSQIDRWIAESRAIGAALSSRLLRFASYSIVRDYSRTKKNRVFLQEPLVDRPMIDRA